MHKSPSIGMIAVAAALALGSGRADADGVRARHTCFGSRDIPSPDGKLVAQVRETGSLGCGESQVAILDQHGRRVAERDFSSPDGSNGEVVEKAAWSEDGAFFVFSMSSSGGHEAQHFPTYLFSQAARSLRNVEGLVPQLYVASQEFQIAHHKLTVDDLGHGQKTITLHD